MTQFGFYYDASNCIGCHTCQVACKDTHKLEVGENYRTVRTFCSGSGYTPHLYHLSLSCHHCANAPCISACSLQAISRNEEGLVLIDEDSCNGCGDCLDACPYNSIVMLREGFAGKCNGCIELRSIGEEPACVASCPQRVLEFGDISLLVQKHASENLVSETAAMPSSKLTNPNLFMQIKTCMNDADYDELII